MNQNKKIFISGLICLCLMLMISQSFAGIGNRRGTASATELLIPIGSRGTAMGGAVSAITYGAEAIFWNPAGMAASPSRAEIMVSHLNWLAGINVDFAAAYANMGSAGSFGFSFKTLSFGEIPVTTEFSPDGTGEFYSPSFITVGLTYSRAMTDRIMAGVNVKIISEKVVRMNSSGVAFDLGLQYLSPSGVRIGVVLCNLGPDMTANGSNAEYLVDIPGTEAGAIQERMRVPLARFELPTTLDIGLSYDLKVADQNIVTVAGSFINNNFGLDSYKMAMEYSFNKMVFLRAGYSMAYDTDSGNFYTADDNHYLFGPSMGAGLNYKITSGMTLALDYAWRQTQLFEDNQWLTLNLKF
jgi:opacity protein-like surface antigen